MKVIAVFISILFLLSTINLASASYAVTAAADRAAATKLQAGLKQVYESEMKEIGIGAGIANGTQPEESYETLLEEDDVAFLKEGYVQFNNGEGYDDYEYSEVLTLADDSPSIETSLSKAGVDKGYGSDLAMEVDVDSIYYYFRFEDPINISKASLDYPIELNLLGNYIKITGVDYDETGAATIISTKTGETYFMQVGETVEVNGHNVKLENIASELVGISVDGGAFETIGIDKTHTWAEGLEINVDSIFYKAGAPETSTTNLIIGASATKTYENNEEFIGEDEDNEKWRWALENLGANAKTVVTAAGTATGPILGVRNYFVVDGASDNDPAAVTVGGCYQLTQGSDARLCISGLNTYSYADLTIDFTTVDLRDAGGSFAGLDAASTPVLRFTLADSSTNTLSAGQSLSTQGKLIKLNSVDDNDGANLTVGSTTKVLYSGSSATMDGLKIEVTMIENKAVTFTAGTSGTTALRLDRDGLMGDTGYLDSDVETDTVYIYVNSSAGAPFNTGHPILDVFYIDENNDVAIAGNLTSDAAGPGLDVMNSTFMYVDFSDTKDEDIQFWLNMDKGAASFFYLNITSNGEERVGDSWGNDNISVYLYNSTTEAPAKGFIVIATGQGEWDQLGTNPSEADPEDLLYQNSLFAAEIGEQDADLRTEYGIIIKNPEENCGDDEVNLLIPGDAVRANVAMTSQGFSVRNATGIASLPTIDTVRLDIEVANSSVIPGASVIIGGPAANKYAAEFMGKEFPTYGEALGWEDGWCFIKEYTKDFKDYTVIAGWDDADTVRCVDVYLKGSSEYNRVM